MKGSGSHRKGRSISKQRIQKYKQKPPPPPSTPPSSPFLKIEQFPPQKM